MPSESTKTAHAGSQGTNAPATSRIPRSPDRSGSNTTGCPPAQPRKFRGLRLPMMRGLQLGAALIVGIAASGCRTSTAAQPLAPEMAGSEPEAQMEFWHALPERRVASNDEAFHALLLFIDGADPAADYDTRVQAMRDRKMLPAAFNGTAGEAVKRGTLAVALARALEVKGGLSMRLFGPTPRYAVRELQYAGLFPQSSPQQTFSGPELLGIIARAEDFQRMYNEDALADGAPSESPTDPPRGPADGRAGENAGAGGDAPVEDTGTDQAP